MRLCLLLVLLTTIQTTAKPTPGLAGQAVFVTPDGTTTEDEAIRTWQQRAEKGHSPDALEQLGWAFVAKARATLDDGYYSLALLTADVSESRHGITSGERLLRGHVLLNLHRFREAEAIARKLLAGDASPRSHALLSDALVELGRIDEAVAACQRFVSVQPGLGAYARVAHVRWLTGDLPGAAAAMEWAVRAGSAHAAESRAWALARLAQYRLQLGRADEALRLSESALAAQPDFAPALLARGQALLALDRAPAAVDSLRRAATQVPMPTYQWWLADAQRAVSDIAGAAETETALQRHGARGDPRTFALYLATRGEQAATATRLARRELETRADPHSFDALAWCLFAAGELGAAEETIQRALAAGTDDPRLHLHAGSIALAQGRVDAARHHLTRATPGAATLTPSERQRLASEQRRSRAASTR